MRTKLSREDQVQRNRDLVLAAARRVFLARGYVSATLDAIAEDAGFSKGVVYSQFESKADMFLALLEERIAERQAQNRQLAAGLGGRDFVVAMHEVAMALQRTEPEWTHLVLEFRVHAARVPELSRRYAALHDRTVSGVAAVIAGLHDQAGTTPRYPVRILAEMVLSIDVGTFVERLVNPSGAELPFPEVIGELLLQTAPPAADER